MDDTLADQSTVSNRSVRFNDQVRVKSIAARKNAGMDAGAGPDDLDEPDFDLDLNDDGMEAERGGFDPEEDEDEEGLDLEDLQQSDLEDDEEMEGDANELDGEIDDYEGEAIERFKNDLFEEEEESDQDEGEPACCILIVMTDPLCCLCRSIVKTSKAHEDSFRANSTNGTRKHWQERLDARW